MKKIIKILLTIQLLTSGAKTDNQFTKKMKVSIVH